MSMNAVSEELREDSRITKTERETERDRERERKREYYPHQKEMFMSVRRQHPASSRKMLLVCNCYRDE